MTRVYSLEQINAAERSWAGEKAFFLGKLKRQGLPVVDGQVLMAEAWHRFLGKTVWPPTVNLPKFDWIEGSPPQQQERMTALRAAIAATRLSLNLQPLLFSPQTLLLLRPSIALRGSPESQPPPPVWPPDFLGLLPARLCLSHATALQTTLRDCWTDALRLNRLLVWQRYCASLEDLRLAILAQPVYPATASGTVILAGATAQVEAVEGLGFALTWGEAVPARITLHSAHIDTPDPDWQSGYQEQAYRLRQRPSARLESYIRSQSQLTSPLTAANLQTLYQLAQQAQAHLGSAVRLEWLRTGDRHRAEFHITQAMPWHESPRPGDSVAAIPRQTLAPAPAPRSARPPDFLESAIEIVIRGIGAASGQATGSAIVVQDAAELLGQPLKDRIIVAPDLQPDSFVRLQGAAGIVIEQGGATCHAAILARELGIPAIVGAPQVSQLLATGNWLWLNGDQGVVYLTSQRQPESGQGLWPTPGHRPRTVSSPEAEEPSRLAIAASLSTEVATAPLRTRMMVNLSQPAVLSQLPETVDGVGLLRAEWLLLEVLEGRHPQDWVEANQGRDLQQRLQERLEPIVATLDPRPVRYRSLDLRSHEWRGLKGSPVPEPNPMLGLRGTLSYQRDPRLFDVELAALRDLQRQGYSNLQLILPFVRSPEEVLACRRRIDRIGLSRHPGFQLWMMAEVPSVLFLLSAYVQAGIQGITIGSNDLTQLLLAVDRDQPAIASAYDERHPAVMAAIGHLIRHAHALKLDSALCGQAPVRHPQLIEQFVEWGVGGLSVEPGAFRETYQRVWQAEQRSLPNGQHDPRS